MHFEVSLIVKVQRAKAYSVYTDFEAMPRWSSDKHGVKVVRREGNTVYFERALGTIRGARGMKLFPPERVESEGETRFSRTRSVVTFDEVPEGTRITASLDVELKGRWSWIFKTQGKAEVESSAMGELESFARYVEGAAGSNARV
ncbi:MAG TPA: SRPBCC family protein [Nitrososphaerales archaeon]|nr:SRPBCC family protein [Nitrososphaerales archaeon]